MLRAERVYVGRGTCFHIQLCAPSCKTFPLHFLPSSQEQLSGVSKCFLKCLGWVGCLAHLLVCVRDAFTFSPWLSPLMFASFMCPYLCWMSARMRWTVSMRSGLLLVVCSAIKQKEWGGGGTCYIYPAYAWLLQQLAYGPYLPGGLFLRKSLREFWTSADMCGMIS